MLATCPMLLVMVKVQLLAARAVSPVVAPTAPYSSSTSQVTGALAGVPAYVEGMVMAVPPSSASDASPWSLTACHPATASTSQTMGSPYPLAVITSFSTTEPV